MRAGGALRADRRRIGRCRCSRRRQGAAVSGFGGRTAIVGIGQTEFSHQAGRSELQLACEAIVAALADAGLSPADVDGLVSYTIDPVEETELVRSVGFREIGFSSRVPYGGGGPWGRLLHAAQRGRERRRRRRRRLPEPPGPVGRDPVRWRQDRAEPRRRATPAPPAMQWCMPHGVLTPASWMALNSTRYMHQYGVHQRRHRPRRRAAAGLCGHQPERVVVQAADHPRGPPGVAVDRRAVHPPVGLLPGDRRLGGARHRPARSGPPTSPTPAGHHRRGRGRRAVRAGDRLRPLPPRPVGDGGLGRARPGGCSMGSASAARTSTPP